VTVLVGGVGQLFQGDLDLARHIVAALAADPPPGDVLVEDLHYGAVAVAQRLQDLRPQALVLVGATPRGRPPGTVERRRIDGVARAPAELQRAVGEAVTGTVSIDLVVEVAFALGALPASTVAVEVEPASLEPAEELSAEARRRLPEVVALVREEVRGA
jgi:hydrogenase maturation protease